MVPAASIAMERLRDGGLCLLFDPALREDWRTTVRDLAAAGVPWFQLRAKTATPERRRRWADEARQAVGDQVLIINDDPDLALACGADGVHVGEGDPSPADARGTLGAAAVVGATGSNGRWRRLAGAPIDYLGIGPLRETTTKPGAAMPLGLEGLAGIIAAVGVPVLAIGGVGLDDVAGLRRIGAHGIAVQSAVWSADAPVAAAGRILEAWRRAA